MKAILLSLTACSVLLVASVASAQLAPPPGGWSYVFDGNAAVSGSGAVGAFDALDGTWSHDNGSDAWDGSAIGAGAPGGASALSAGGANFLRIQDPGDPRDYGMPDPSNRKVYLGHNITANGAGSAVLNDGVTLNFRIKIALPDPLDSLYPDGGSGIVPVPGTGDGYLIHDGGKGNISIKQAGIGGGVGEGVISFSLATAFEATGPGLVMNNLNGTAVSGTVDTGEAGTLNMLPIVDPTQWHDFWITIQAGGAGTHVVNVYMDGAMSSTTYNVTAGNGDDYDGISYLGIGAGSTGFSGAFDLDYLAFAPGVFAPVPEPSTWALLILGGLGLWGLRRRVN